MKLRLFLAATAAFAAALTTAASAFSAPACGAITKLATGGDAGADPAPPVVYVTGSSALKPIFAALAPIAFADPVQPFTIVYTSQGSCLGAKAILSGAPMASNDTTNASYWDPNSLTVASSGKTAKEESCTLSNGQIADIGASDVFAQTCGLALQGLPTGFADFQGPIQSMTFAVNKGSKEQSISAEAAYMLFGFATLAPWTNNSLIFRRNESSGTQSMIATAIGVDATRWKGQNAGSSDGVFAGLTNLVNQTDIDSAVGILAADYSSRTELKQLAYQHYGQRCGFKPDIQPLDKRNVREGRYAIWGPLHLFTQVDGTGFAKNAAARNLIAYLLGTQPPPLGLNLIRTEVGLHVVPPCAMKVQRTSEVGPISSYKPLRACGCAFDKEALGTTTCKACTTNAECAADESCNFNFCEKQ